MNNLAIGINWDGYTVSLETEQGEQKNSIIRKLHKLLGFSIDEILLVRSSSEGPLVIAHWTDLCTSHY